MKLAYVAGAGMSVRRRKDLAGQKFGRLTAIELYATSGQSQWLCVCECGTHKVVRAAQLRNGKTRSCGCLRREAIGRVGRDQNTTHGMTNSREFGTWRGMLRRCEDRGHDSFAKYGAVGIAVCERWHKFENFFSDMGPMPDGAPTIDRIDGAGGYNPENCRWATWKEQLRNRPNYNHMITWNGKTLCLSAWAEELGVCIYRLRRHIKTGRPIGELRCF
jgi:hypothetical protein